MGGLHRFSPVRIATDFTDRLPVKGGSPQLACRRFLEQVSIFLEVVAMGLAPDEFLLVMSVTVPDFADNIAHDLLQIRVCLITGRRDMAF